MNLYIQHIQSCNCASNLIFSSEFLLTITIFILCWYNFKYWPEHFFNILPLIRSLCKNNEKNSICMKKKEQVTILWWACATWKRSRAKFAMPRLKSGLDIAAAPSADDATRLYSMPSNRTQLRHGCNLRRSLFHLKVRCRESVSATRQQPF